MRFTIILGTILLALGEPMRVGAVPALPEPGVIFYGNVRSSTDNQLLPITAAVFQVTENGVLTPNRAPTTVSLNGTSNPPVRVINVNGLSFYIARVPFSTRSIGTAVFDSVPATIFELGASSSYTRQATINGRPATFANSAQVSFSLSAAERGRFEQVDFVITPETTTGTYTSWAQTYFANTSAPEAQQGADPDGDGLTNAQEFGGGTSPVDPLSALKTIFVEPLGNGGFRLVWKSVPGKTYTVEKATDPQLQVWSQVGTSITATGETAEFTDSSAQNDTVAHYRIRTAR